MNTAVMIKGKIFDIPPLVAERLLEQENKIEKLEEKLSRADKILLEIKSCSSAGSRERDLATGYHNLTRFYDNLREKY